MSTDNSKKRLFEVIKRLDNSFGLNESKNSKKEGHHTNIEKDTLENNSFRKVLYTSNNLQLVLMSLKPNENIGLETHSNIDQFFRIESGNGEGVINDIKYRLKSGDSIIVPAGSKHDIINTGKKDLKIYTLYSPPNHKDGIEFKTKEDATNSKEKFNGKISEK